MLTASPIQQYLYESASSGKNGSLPLATYMSPQNFYEGAYGDGSLPLASNSSQHNVSSYVLSREERLQQEREIARDARIRRDSKIDASEAERMELTRQIAEEHAQWECRDTQQALVEGTNTEVRGDGGLASLVSGLLEAPIDFIMPHSAKEKVPEGPRIVSERVLGYNDLGYSNVPLSGGQVLQQASVMAPMVGNSLVNGCSSPVIPSAQMPMQASLRAPANGRLTWCEDKPIAKEGRWVWREDGHVAPPPREFPGNFMPVGGSLTVSPPIGGSLQTPIIPGSSGSISAPMGGSLNAPIVPGPIMMGGSMSAPFPMSGSFSAPPVARNGLGMSTPMPSCAICGKQATNLCGGCQTVAYCSQACQKQHWPSHKVACKKMQGAQNQFSVAPAIAAPSMASRYTQPPSATSVLPVMMNTSVQGPLGRLAVAAQPASFNRQNRLS